MPVIDADCHVIEPEHTWDYFDDSEVRFRPLTLLSPKDGRQFLAVDGRIRGATTAQDDRGRNDSGKREAREEMAGFARTSVSGRSRVPSPAVSTSA